MRKALIMKRLKIAESVEVFVVIGERKWEVVGVFL